MVYEIGAIAHACGAAEPRLLRREHARIVCESGRSVALSELYPQVSARAETKLAS